MDFTRDTPSKKVTRLAVWKRVKEMLGPRFYTGSHLVLLSAGAGDVSTLLGLGVSASRIIGVDHDLHAASAAKFKHENVRCIRGDIEDVAKKLKGEGVVLVSAFFDFCGPLRETTVGKVVATSVFLDPKAAVAIAVKMGREQGEWADRVNKAKDAVPTGSAAFYLRVDILTHELMKRGRSVKRCVVPEDFYRCSSKRATGEHSEMLVCVGQLSATKHLMNDPKKAAKRACSEAYYSTIAVDYSAIGPLAALLASREEDAHLLLNLRSESIPAYLAHGTRGTYEGRNTHVSRHRRKY